MTTETPKAPSPAPMPRPAVPTVALEQLRGRTYASFSAAGMHVDLDAFFSTEAGQQAIREVAESARR